MPTTHRSELVTKIADALTDEAYDGSMGPMSETEFPRHVLRLAETAVEVIERDDFESVRRFAEIAAANFDSELDYFGDEIKRRIQMDAHNLDPEHPGEGEPCAVCEDDNTVDGGNDV